MAWAEHDPDVALWWQDECWFSRFAQPNAHDWGGIDLLERPVPAKAPDKALACYGAVQYGTNQMELAFCPGQPNSDFTLAFLSQVLSATAQAKKRVAIVIWDHASWHKSKRVKTWVRLHNKQVKQHGGVRLIVWLLPKKSPWLNPIEPRWLHGKRAALEPGAADLTPDILTQRLCAYYHTEFVSLDPNQVS
jgi:hypothetical protein